MKLVLRAMLITGLITANAQAQEKKPEVRKVQTAPSAQTTSAAAAAPAAPEVKLDKDRISYAIGMYFGNMIKRQGTEVDADTISKAIKDILAGGTTRFTEQEAQQIMMAMNKEAAAKREADAKVAGEKNKKEGEGFLAENGKKAGVKTLPSGLQYKVITEGTGPMPKSSDSVSTQYKGRLINGTEFDSSYKRGQPAEFPVTGVIPGWTEALQLMKTGAKWELYIPSNLAYKERGSPPVIGPNATLIFEIELVAIKAPPTPVESSQAVSGEIIKVPSKAELDKGAKIEVIRPGQTNELNPKK
ncbi:MAG: FKBP-type peptidyl-prolyl cis-trans isomerase [Verrucomicrobiota bacterium]